MLPREYFHSYSRGGELRVGGGFLNAESEREEEECKEEKSDSLKRFSESEGGRWLHEKRGEGNFRKKKALQQMREEGGFSANFDREENMRSRLGKKRRPDFWHDQGKRKKRHAKERIPYFRKGGTLEAPRATLQTDSWGTRREKEG